ncbi:MAG TPA: ferredoxin, partial [Actinomycetes bacterium]|nr:ferredoxin [Actinomycetes bacterium]
CQGHGRCYSLAPGLFGCDDEGYAVLEPAATGEIAPEDEAAARLAAARRLLPARPAEGRTELERAIAFFREAGASASLDQAKDLLFALT